MGRKVSMDMTCDRCDTSFEGNEIDLLAKDAVDLVDSAKDGLSDVPAFEATLGADTIKYDDLCDGCTSRVTGLFGDLGKVQRRGYTRKTTSGKGEPDGKEEAKGNGSSGNGSKDPETKGADGGKADAKGGDKGKAPPAAKAPSKPKPPQTAPA